ncbi:MAG: hypothetical protein Kow0069_20750 [Promethearchaeota archaeon]
MNSKAWMVVAIAWLVAVPNAFWSNVPVASFASLPGETSVPARDKIDPQLLPLVDDPFASDELVDAFVLQWPDSSVPMGEFALLVASAATVENLEVVDLLNGVRCQVRAGDLMNLALLSEVYRVWSNRQVRVKSAPELTNALPRLASSGGSQWVDAPGDVGARDLWELGYDGTDVIIAVLDAGVDLSGQIGQYGGDLDDFDEDPSTTDYKFVGAVSTVPEEPLYYTDFTGRGTYHAGIACGTGYWNETFVGVAPGARYMNVKVYDSLGLTFWSFVVSGIDWAVKHGADVILFCASIPGYYDDPVSVAINEAVERGVVVVAPAGDEGPAYMSLDTPGQAPGAITVGAYDSWTGEVADFSSRGPALDFRVGPDVVAPGVDLVGPRSQVFASSYSNVESLFTQFGFDLGDVLGLTFTSGIPADAFPRPVYGEVVAENYTRSSGTGAAAAVVAGVVALLLEAFPLATPHLIREALQRTARPISGDENAEGAGLVDAVGAFQFLDRRLGSGRIPSFPLTAPLLYPGAVTSVDTYNLSSNSSAWPAGYRAYDSGLLLSTQAMASVAFVTNVSDANFTTVHLPLNQFGVRFTSEYASEPLVPLLEPVTGERFVWLSQFDVLREMHLVTEQGPVGPEQYTRYAGVLRYEHLLALVTVDQYSYAGSYDDLRQVFNLSGQVPDWFDVINRINAYRLNLDFINVGDDVLEDVALFSYFKADLNFNETGLGEDVTQALEFGKDDAVERLVDRDTFYAWDENNATDFPYDVNVTAMGFNSTTHVADAWEVGPDLDLVANLTLDQVLYNVSDYEPHVDDPGFATRYHLADALAPGESASFSGLLGIGAGRTKQEAVDAMVDSMALLNSNVTTYNVTDLVLVDANFSRVVYEEELTRNFATFINAGNTELDTVTVTFSANRTNEAGGLEVFSTIFKVEGVKPLDLVEFQANWVPLYADVYSVAWTVSSLDSSAFTGLDPFNLDLNSLLLNQETALLNNFLTRNVIVANRQVLKSWAEDLFRVSPKSLPLAPFTLRHPTEFALVNLTCHGVERVDDVDVTFTGVGSLFATLNETHFGAIVPGQRVQVLLMVPLLTPSGEFNFAVEFKSGETLLARVPVSITVEATRGRVFFDFIHSGLFSLLDPDVDVEDRFDLGEGTQVDVGLLDELWGERLETTYGAFFDLKEAWSSGPMGATVQTVIPFIEVNTSEFVDLSSLPEEASSLTGGTEGGQGGGVGLGLGPYYFESDLISTNYLNHDVLQFFDLLVVQDPEREFTEQELVNVTSWVESGGVLLVLAENRSRNDVDSLNSLLGNFGLALDGNSTGVVELSPTNWSDSDSPLFDGVGSLRLNWPVNFTKTSPESPAVQLCDGGYAFESRMGRGKVLALGDRDFLRNGALDSPDHERFANNCLSWAFGPHYEFSLEVTSEQVELGTQDYLYIRLDNFDELGHYLDDQFLAVAAFVDEEGQPINASIFGFEIPVMPFLEMDEGYYGTYFDTSWFNATGTVHVQVVLDHPAVASEILFVKFEVVPTSDASVLRDYQFPEPAYPHVYDLVGIVGLVAMVALLWSYNNFKAKRRLQVVELRGPLLNQARTYINEARVLFRQLLVNLEVEETEELEKIRLLLNSRRRTREFYELLRHFGEDVGEAY